MSERRMRIIIEVDYTDQEKRFNRLCFNNQVEAVIHKAFPAVAPSESASTMRLVYLASEDASEPQKLASRSRVRG